MLRPKINLEKHPSKTSKGKLQSSRKGELQSPRKDELQFAPTEKIIINQYYGQQNSKGDLL